MDSCTIDITNDHTKAFTYWCVAALLLILFSIVSGALFGSAHLAFLDVIHVLKLKLFNIPHTELASSSYGAERCRKRQVLNPPHE